MDAYVYIKKRKNKQDGQAVFFDIQKWSLGPDHVAKHVAETERKLQTCHYDGERNGWDWEKYVTLHKEQHAIMKSLTYNSYSDMDSGTKIHCFLGDIKSTELEAVVNVVWAQPEKYGIMMQLCLIWPKWSQRKAYSCILSILWRLEVI